MQIAELQDSAQVPSGVLTKISGLSNKHTSLWYQLKMGNNPHILFLIRSLERGGAERQLVLLASGLRRQGWLVAVACFYAGGPFQGDLERAGVQVINLAKRGRWDMFGFLWRLMRMFRKNAPRYCPRLLAGCEHSFAPGAVKPTEQPSCLGRARIECGFFSI